MTTDKHAQPSPRDSDLDTLFDADKSQPSESIDAAIIAAANAAAQNAESTPETTQTSATPTTRAHEVLAGSKPLSAFPQRWVAAVATITLSVGLGLLLLTPPVSDHDSVQTVNAESTADMVMTTAQSSLLEHESPSAFLNPENTDEARADSAADVARAPSAMVADTPTPASRTAAKTESTTDASDGGAAGDQLIVYRRSAEEWIKQIRSLIESGNRDDAREEYRLFQEAHPDHPPGDLALDDLLQ